MPVAAALQLWISNVSHQVVGVDASHEGRHLVHPAAQRRAAVGPWAGGAPAACRRAGSKSLDSMQRNETAPLSCVHIEGTRDLVLCCGPHRQFSCSANAAQQPPFLAWPPKAAPGQARLAVSPSKQAAIVVRTSSPGLRNQVPGRHTLHHGPFTKQQHSSNPGFE